MVFPTWLYRRGDGVAAFFETADHFDNMKDKALWQETPWRPSKVKFCAECEKLRELVKNLESELAEKDKTIEGMRATVKIKRAVL